MRKILFLFLMFVSTSCFAAGPVYRQKDATTQLEFENVYQDIRSVTKISSSTLPTGSTNYIQNSTTLQSGATAFAQFTYTSSFTVVGSANTSGTIGGLVINNGSGNALSQIKSLDSSAIINVTAGGTGVSGNFNTGIANADLSAIELSGSNHNAIQFNEDAHIIQAASRSLNIWTNGVKVASFSAAGSITQPLQPSFLVTNSAGQTDVTGDGTAVTITWGNEITDRSGSFASNTFTAPITGDYLLTTSVLLRQLAATHTSVILSITTSNREYRITDLITTLSDNGMALHDAVVADMDTNDTATVVVTVSGGTKVVDIDNDAKQNYFSGTLLN